MSLLQILLNGGGTYIPDTPPTGGGGTTNPPPPGALPVGYEYNATVAAREVFDTATAVVQARVTGGTFTQWNSTNLNRLGLVPVSTGATEAEQSLLAKGRSTYAVEFTFTGLSFDVEASAGWVQVWADNKLVGAAQQVGTDQSVRVTLPSATSRRIFVEIGATSTLSGGTGSNPRLSGIRHFIGAISNPNVTRRRVFILGDSWVEGAGYAADGNNSPAMRHMAWVAGRYVDADVYYNGVSGSGYKAGDNFNKHYLAAARVAQIVSANPHEIIIFGSINDIQSSDVTINAAQLYDSLKTQLPNARIVVIGRQSYNDGTNTNGVDEDIQDAVMGKTNAVGYVSPRSEAWVTGSGNTVNPAGNGTADQYHNGSNLQHLSDAGNLYYGQKIAQALVTLIPSASALATIPTAKLYDVPLTAPYNSPVPLVTPTYDGTGEAIHPKVLDFGPAGWNGWRYWMAHTPFTGGNDRTENPSLLVSQNGYYWRVPPGCRDPLYPAPPVPGFGSDTHLEYDEENDEIVILFRQTLNRVAHKQHIARSSDGITWPAESFITDQTYPDSDQQTISPVLLRIGPTDWRMFGLSYGSKALDMWKAPAPEGPWSGPYKTVGVGISGPTWNWHLEVEYIDGVFRCLVDRGPLHEGRPDGYRASSSRDGLSWTTTTSDFMTLGPDGKWDDGQHYRACMLPDESGEKYRIWYSAHSNEDPRVWGIGYTEVPRTLWPTPPPVLAAGSGTAYRDLALGHGSAMMWRLGTDVQTSTAEPDASGNSRTGTYTGRFVRTNSITGEAGYASRFDQGYCYRAYEPWMTTAGFTVRAVIHPENTFASRAFVSLRGANGGWMFKAQGGSIQFVHMATNTVIQGGTISASSINSPTPYHVAATVAADGTVNVYRNGVVTASGVIPTTYDLSGARFTVGGSWTGSVFSDFFTGRIEYVDFVPSVLTGAQIAASSTEALS